MVKFFPIEIPPSGTPETSDSPTNRLKFVVGTLLSKPQPYPWIDQIPRGRQEQVPNAQTLLFVPFGSGENARAMPILLSGFGENGPKDRVMQIELRLGASQPPLNPEVFYRNREWWTYPFDSEGEESGPEIPATDQQMNDYAAWLETEGIRPATPEEVAIFLQS